MGYDNGSIGTKVFEEAQEAFTNLANSIVIDRKIIQSQKRITENLTSHISIANSQIVTLARQIFNLSNWQQQTGGRNGGGGRRYCGKRNYGGGGAGYCNTCPLV